MSWIMEVLAKTEMQTVVLGMLGFLFAYLKRREVVQRWKLGVALKSLEAGVRETYEEYVRSIKEGSIDGKLTDAERAEARTRAIDKAKAYANEHSLNLVKYYGKEYLPVIIEKIVARSKTAGKIARGVLPFPEPQLPLG